jgi:shikimate dehydrogenase
MCGGIVALAFGAASVSDRLPPRRHRIPDGKDNQLADRYAVIGNPVAHSKSPDLHAAFARQCRQDMQYGAILGPLDRFRDAVMTFRDNGGKGLNVTAPFKLEAFALADQLTERARLAQAVNTLKFEAGWIVGDNTDGVGLVRDIRDRLGMTLEGRRILLLGAGGAACGVLHPILEQRPARLAIANNTLAKALALQQQVADRMQVEIGGFQDFAGGRFDLVINATSAALNGEGVSLPAAVFADGALAYDMTYRAGNTPFMDAALHRGAARVVDGFGMLAGQAAESFLFWRGMLPDIAPVVDLLRPT